MRQQYRDDLAEDGDNYDDEGPDEGYDDSYGGGGEFDRPGGELEPAAPMVVSRGPAGAELVVRHRSVVADQAARRVPYVATAATGAAGLTALGLAEAAAAAGQPALAGTIAVGTWIVTGAGLPVLRIRFRDRTGRDGCTVERIPRGFRRRWWVAGGAAALWVDAMAAGAVHVVGPWGMAAVLLGGAAAVSARWMRVHAVELPTDTPPALPPAPLPPAIEPVPVPAPLPVRFPAPPPPDEGDLIAELWESRVASGPNAIVPGSELGDDRVDLPHAYQWVIQLDPIGTVTCTQLSRRAEDIALKLGVKTTHVSIDHLPGEDDREDRALLTVIIKNVLDAGVAYHGPVYNNGLIPLGPFADLSGHPNWVARDDTGPQHGMVTGGTRSGKSELLARLGMALRASGEWIVLFADGDEQGRSSPLLKRIAYDFAKGATEVMAQLEAMEAWFHARGSIMGRLTDGPDGTPILRTDPAREGEVNKIMPCRAYPGFVWILDEFHRLVRALGRPFVERVAALVRVISKVGGAVYVGTQSATVGDFGDDEVFRGQLAQGNAVIMRTKSKTEQYVVGDFGCDPTTLPKGGGWGFVDDADGRKMMFRGEYDKNMARWVSTLPPYRPDQLAARVYAAKRPPTPADPVADYQESQRRVAAIEAALDAGAPMPWEDQPAPAEPAAPPVSSVGGDGVAAPVSASYAGPARWSAGGVEIAEPILGPMFAGAGSGLGEPAQQQPELPRALTGTERAVLDRLVAASGSERNAAIIRDTDLSDTAVSRALAALVKLGYADRRGHGLHEASAAGRATAIGYAPPEQSTTEQTRMVTALRLLGEQHGVGDDLVDAYLAGDLPEPVRAMAEHFTQQLDGAP